MSVRGLFRAVEGAIVGTILYVPLLFLPLAGPLLAGLAAGKTARNTPGKGFLLGLFCGVAGSVIWLFSILPGWEIKPEWFYWILWMIFLLWNVLSTVLCAFGGLMGAMVAASNETLLRMQKAAAEQGKTSAEREPPTYVVCPACGTSNPDGSRTCECCNTQIQS